MINKGNIIFLCIIILNICLSFVSAINKTNNYDLITISNLEAINHRLYYEELILNYINDNLDNINSDDFKINDFKVNLKIYEDTVTVYIYDLDIFITYIIKDHKVYDYY